MKRREFFGFLPLEMVVRLVLLALFFIFTVFFLFVPIFHNNNLAIASGTATFCLMIELLVAMAYD